LRWRSGGVEHPHDTPPYPFLPSPTFAHSSAAPAAGGEDISKSFIQGGARIIQVGQEAADRTAKAADEISRSVISAGSRVITFGENVGQTFGNSGGIVSGLRQIAPTANQAAAGVDKVADRFKGLSQKEIEAILKWEEWLRTANNL